MCSAAIPNLLWFVEFYMPTCLTKVSKMAVRSFSFRAVIYLTNNEVIVEELDMGVFKIDWS